MLALHVCGGSHKGRCDGEKCDSQAFGIHHCKASGDRLVFPSTLMLAPILVSSSTYLKRFSKILSVLTMVDDIRYIQRGYEDFHLKLQGLGAQIELVETVNKCFSIFFSFLWLFLCDKKVRLLSGPQIFRYSILLLLEINSLRWAPSRTGVAVASSILCISTRSPQRQTLILPASSERR